MTTRFRAVVQFLPVQLVLFLTILVGLHASMQQLIWVWFYWSLSTPKAPAIGNWILVADFLVDAALMLAAYCALVLWIERRSPIELLKAIPAHLGLGIAIGLGLISSACLLLAVCGVATLSAPSPSWHTLFTPQLVACMALPVCEELIFRGAIFRMIEKSCGTIAGLFLSALFFGLVHMANPNASIFSALAIALEAGILLGLAYSATRNLWVPIGLHIGWNFGEGEIFGAPVSGIARPGLLHFEASGPDFLTGGEFGPEGSIVAVSLSLVMASVFLWLTLRRRFWVATRMIWRSPLKGY